MTAIEDGTDNFNNEEVFLMFYKIIAFVLFIFCFQSASGQYVGRSVAIEPNDVSVIYDNGAFSTGTVSRSGVTAPPGYTWSENQNNSASTTETNSTLGQGATVAINSLADDFTVPNGQRWLLSSVSVYGYFAGWTAPQSPFTGGFLRIWSGRPGDSGSTIVFGDTTTDRLLSSNRANTYVISNSTIPSPGVVPGTTRELWENRLSISPSLTLEAGTYWIEFATSTFANGTQFYRSVVSIGNRTQSGWNARQYTISTNSWLDAIDTGNPASAPDVAQDISFKINGTIAAPEMPTFMDYDGDGKTDFGITRWGAQPTDPSSWYILRNNGTGIDYISTVFGVRVGTNRQFSGVNQIDVVLPEDYDGDGKTDIAIYDGGRASAASPATTFWILNSSDNTFRSEQFGSRLDAGNIMGDYDGDGKADLAIWRQGTTVGSQSTFWIKKSSSGQVTATNWGIRGDRPFIGDYDGDGKMDFAVARVSQSTGEAIAYILRSSDSQYEVRAIEYPFHFIVPGDYDGDGKTDIATIRSSNNDMLWTIQRSSDNVTERIRCGVYNLDFPAQGDYDGDGKTDTAVWRRPGLTATDPATFWVRRSNASYQVVQWGHGLDSSIASIRAY